MKNKVSAPGGSLSAVFDNPAPPPVFRYILFERVNPERNEARYYYLSLQPTLFHPLAVVRFYGRKGQSQREIAPTPVSDLTEAWPLLRRVIRARLRHGYQIKQCSLPIPGNP